MVNRPFLDFYASKSIIPVHQDMSDITGHFARRTALYHHLGVTMNCVRGRSVIEFGPGTGDNAVHISSWGPALYVLVDGNPASIEALKQKSAALLAKSEIHYSDILNYVDMRHFDVVLCEALIPGQRQPAEFLQRIASFVAPSGLLVCTSISPESYLAETCRRMILPIFATHFPDLGARIEALTRFFTPDLESLPGMSRLHADWVLDNIIHPHTSLGLFAMDEAIRTH